MYYCKWHIAAWILMAVIVFLASCKENTAPKQTIYFDTQAYFQQEKDGLFHQQGTMQKTLELNGKKEEISLNAIDTSQLQNYINIFNNSNLNKTIYIGEYEIDTFWMLDPQTYANIEVLTYKSKDEKNDVKWLQVYSNGNMKAALQSKNFLFSNYKEVFYEKDKAFSLIAWQKTLGLDTVKTFTEVEILP